MQKSQIIHAVAEVVVISVLSVYLVKKINECNKEIASLKAVIQRQDELLSKCINSINDLYGIIDQLTGMRPPVRRSAPSVERMSMAPGMSGMPQGMPQGMAQGINVAMPQQSGGPPVDILSSIMGIVPTMISTISTPNAAAGILETLDKQGEKAQEEKPQVSVLDETQFENDEDINAALNETSTNATVSVEDDSS